MRALHLLLASVSFAGGLISLSAANATVISYPNGTTTTASKPCDKFAGATCTTDAFFDAMSLDDLNDETIDPNFSNEFNAWNATNRGNAKWTLQFGGNPNGTFNVTLARASLTSAAPGCAATNPAGATCGGLLIRISLTGVALPAVGNNQVLGWSQGFFNNISPDLTKIVAPYFDLDIAAFGCDNATGPTCPPMYPFQFADSHFGDAPSFRFEPPGAAQAFFEADAYLSLADYTARTLTVYDGIDYAYFNSVIPEPPVWTCIIPGLAGLIMLRWSRYGRHINI